MAIVALDFATIPAIACRCILVLWRRVVSFQITVMKVLAGHPDGRASVADVKQYVAVLMCSGADWSKRMKCLVAQAPDLDIFSSGYVLRDATGWQITDAGRAFLTSIECPVAQSVSVDYSVAPPTIPVADPASTAKIIRIADFAARRRDAA